MMGTLMLSDASYMKDVRRVLHERSDRTWDSHNGLNLLVEQVSEANFAHMRLRSERIRAYLITTCISEQ